MTDRPMLKIGEVAEQVGLSLRTIRFYEEEGLVVPETRTSGGFRLYSSTAVRRLELIKRMKPLGFSVEEMVEILSDLDALADGTAGEQEQVAIAERFDAHNARVRSEVAELQAKAARGLEFGEHLRRATEHPPTAGH